MGLGNATSIKWLIEGEVHAGTFCTAQGFLRQLGGVGVALATLAIAVQTFVTIWWLKDPKKFIAFISVGIQCTLAVLIVGIPYGLHTHPPNNYYVIPTPYWCSISQNFKNDRITNEYAWYWLALLVSVILYLLLFLLHWGVIEPGRKWYSPTMLARNDSTEHIGHGGHQLQFDTSSRNPGNLWTAILYPIVYSVVILPLSIVRWITFAQIAKFGESRISPVATFVVATLFSLSGILDALTYLVTRTRFFFPKEKDTP